MKKQIEERPVIGDDILEVVFRLEQIFFPSMDLHLLFQPWGWTAIRREDESYDETERYAPDH